MSVYECVYFTGAEMMNKIRCSTVCTVCSKSEKLPVSTNTEEEESSHLKSSLSS